MLNEPLDDLVDRIYEAAVVPEQWPKVLDGLSAIADGDGALIITRNALQEHWIGTGRADTFFRVGVEQDWHGERNPRAPRFFAARYPGFVNDFDLLSREEIETHPYYTEFLRPLGLGWGTATAIEVPSGDVIGFDIECRFERGPVERSVMQKLDKLRPHLARASLISSRLAFERVRSAAQTLGLIGLPAGVLGARGQLLATNMLFETLMPGLASEGRDRLILSHALADMLFVEALMKLLAHTEAQSVRSIPIPAREEEPAFILHVVPIRRTANDIFSSASCILVVTPVEPQKVPTAEVLQGLFDLTPAEARVARGIAEGETLEGIARAHGLSRETVRSQLKATLAKTGLGRQADLVRLLSGITVPPG